MVRGAAVSRGASASAGSKLACFRYDLKHEALFMAFYRLVLVDTASIQADRLDRTPLLRIFHILNLMVPHRKSVDSATVDNTTLCSVIYCLKAIHSSIGLHYKYAFDVQHLSPSAQ